MRILAATGAVAALAVAGCNAAVLSLLATMTRVELQLDAATWGPPDARP